MDKYNLLNYRPMDADILKANGIEAGRRRRKMYQEILTEVLIGGELCEKGSKAERYHKIYSKMLKWSAMLSIPMCLLLLWLAFASAVDFSETVFIVGLAILGLPSIAFCVIMTVTLICMVVFRSRLLRAYLADYEPRCTDLSIELRQNLATAGYSMFFCPQIWAEVEDDSEFVRQVYAYWDVKQEGKEGES